MVSLNAELGRKAYSWCLPAAAVPYWYSWNHPIYLVTSWLSLPKLCKLSGVEILPVSIAAVSPASSSWYPASAPYLGGGFPFLLCGSRGILSVQWVGTSVGFISFRETIIHYMLIFFSFSCLRMIIIINPVPVFSIVAKSRCPISISCLDKWRYLSLGEGDSHWGSQVF